MCLMCWTTFVKKKKKESCVLTVQVVLASTIIIMFNSFMTTSLWSCKISDDCKWILQVVSINQVLCSLGDRELPSISIPCGFKYICHLSYISHFIGPSNIFSPFSFNHSNCHKMFQFLSSHHMAKILCLAFIPFLYLWSCCVSFL